MMACAYAQETQVASAEPQSRNTGPRMRWSGMTAAGASVGLGLSEPFVARYPGVRGSDQPAGIRRVCDAMPPRRISLASRAG